MTLAVVAVTNISGLRGLQGTTNPFVYVEGYNNPGDGGGGQFYYNSNDTSSSDNGATIIVAAAGSRYYRIWQGEAFNVLWAGADATGINPSDAAFSTTVGLSSVVYIPKGRYVLNSNLSYTIPAGVQAFTLLGDGAEQTVIYFPTNGGISITYNPTSQSLAHIRDLTLSGGGSNAGSALHLVYTSTTNIIPGFSEISNVKIRGDDFGQAKYWNKGIFTEGVSSLNFNGVSVTGLNSGAGGNGIVLQGNSIGSIVFNIVSCILDGLANGLTYGNYIQGVAVLNTQFTNCAVGVVSNSGQSKLDQLVLMGCQFATTSHNVLALTSIGNCTFGQNLFTLKSNTTSTSLITGAFTNLSCTGNIFLGPSSTSNDIGIEVTSGPTGIICGNVFGLLSVGVQLDSGTTHYNVQSNLYNAVTTPVVNNGTSNIVGNGST